MRNFVGVIEDISPEASLVETELFPAGALHYYTKKNMGWEYTQEEYDTWQLAERGGEQGDYRDGMPEKIANVIDCLKTEPLSKRAVIPIPYSNVGSATIDWKDRGQNKCCRELHFYLEDGKLKCTGIVRMQVCMGCTVVCESSSVLQVSTQTSMAAMSAECQHFCQEHSFL